MLQKTFFVSGRDTPVYLRVTWPTSLQSLCARLQGKAVFYRQRKGTLNGRTCTRIGTFPTIKTQRSLGMKHVLTRRTCCASGLHWLAKFWQFISRKWQGAVLESWRRPGKLSFLFPILPTPILESLLRRLCHKELRRNQLCLCYDICRITYCTFKRTASVKIACRVQFIKNKKHRHGYHLTLLTSTHTYLHPVHL